MGFLKKLPEGMRYSSSVLCEKMRGTLDLTRTAVCMVPARLKGVDNVIINASQLSYVAPDYKGNIFLRYMDPSRRGSPIAFRSPTADELRSLCHAYEQAQADSPLIFDCSVVKDGKETMLPAGLKFDRGRKILNARQTTLLDHTPVEGIVETMMPDPAIARKILRIKRYKAYQLRCATKRQDCGFIRAICHKRTRISNTHPDRYA